MTVATISQETNVGMGQIALVVDSQLVRAVLGSCIGLAIYDNQNSLGAFAHIVLPSSSGRVGQPGKFADTAVAWMLSELKRHGANPRRLSAKIAGGANMFSSKGPIQIGLENAQAVRHLLKQMDVPLLAEHLGGSQGRRVTFVAEQRSLAVEIAGQPIITL